MIPFILPGYKHPARRLYRLAPAMPSLSTPTVPTEDAVVFGDRDGCE